MDGMLVHLRQVYPQYLCTRVGERQRRAKFLVGTVADGLDATIAKHYIVVTYSRWLGNGVRSRNFGAKQNDFSELLVNPFRLHFWFLESKSLSLYGGRDQGPHSRSPPKFICDQVLPRSRPPPRNAPKMD